MPDPHAAAPRAVISALPRELVPLLRRVRLEGRIPTSCGRFYQARLAARPLIVGWTGDGRRSAEDALRSLLGERAPDDLAFLGVAGALSNALRPRQLVVAAEVRDSGGLVPAPDPTRSIIALAAADAVEGRIYSSDRIVAAATDKARLWEDLGRPAGAVVDLETAAWARVAAERGLPYVAMRAVSDAAGDDLPLDFERFRDRRGRIRNWRVALEAVWRPRLIGPLHRLKRRVDACAGALASWVESYLLGKTCAV